MFNETTIKFILETNFCSETVEDIYQLFVSLKDWLCESDCIKLFNIVESQYDGPINFINQDFLFFLSKTQFIIRPIIFYKLFNLAVANKNFSQIDYLVFLQLPLEDAFHHLDLSVIIRPWNVEVLEFIMKKNLPFVFDDGLKTKILYLTIASDDVKLFTCILNYKIVNYEFIFSQQTQQVFKVIKENIFQAIYQKIDDLTLIKKTSLFQSVMSNPSETIFNTLLNNILSYKVKRNKVDIINNRLFTLMKAGFYISAGECYKLHSSLIEDKTIQLCTTLLEMGLTSEIETIHNRQLRGKIIACVVVSKNQYPKLTRSVETLKCKLKLFKNKFSLDVSLNVIENCVLCYF